MFLNQEKLHLRENTAKLMEENEMLYKLKEMDYVEKIAEITLSGNGSIVKQLKEIFSVN